MTSPLQLTRDPQAPFSAAASYPDAWRPDDQVCHKHQPRKSREGVVGLESFTTREVLMVVQCCFGPHAPLLNGSHVCIFCTCERMQRACKGVQMASVLDGLTSVLGTLSFSNKGAETHPGVKSCAIWAAMFPKLVLPTKNSDLFYEQAKRALRSHQYAPSVLAALLRVRHHHSSRAMLKSLVPTKRQTAAHIHVALVFQRNLQPVAMEDVADRLQPAWLDMPCACSHVPKDFYKEERRVVPQRCWQRGRQAGHTVKNCPLRWARPAGPSSHERACIILRHAKGLGSQSYKGVDFNAPSGVLHIFGLDPRMRVILDTLNADPFADFQNAVDMFIKDHRHRLNFDLTTTELTATCLRFGSAFTTLSLEWPSPPPADFLAGPRYDRFRLAYLSAFKGLARGSGHMNMLAPHAVAPVWSTIRHRHCSESYRELVKLLVLCLQRLAYGVDDYQNHNQRGAQPRPPNINELNSNRLEIFTKFLPPCTVRQARWPSVLSMPHRLVETPSCYAVLHGKSDSDSVSSQKRPHPLTCRDRDLSSKRACLLPQP